MASGRTTSSTSISGRPVTSAAARETRRCGASISTAAAWKSSRAACATRSDSTGIRRRRSSGSPITAATGSPRIPRDELNRVTKRRALRLPVLPPGRLARSGVRLGPLVQGVRAAGREDGTAYRGARHALLHRQHVPGRIPQPIFVARHGSWNRTKKIGGDVVA